MKFLLYSRKDHQNKFKSFIQSKVVRNLINAKKIHSLEKKQVGPAAGIKPSLAFQPGIAPSHPHTVVASYILIKTYINCFGKC